MDYVFIFDGEPVELRSSEARARARNLGDQRVGVL